MPPKRWQNIEELFHAALACTPRQREDLFADADPDLRRQVLLLLQANDVTASFERSTIDVKGHSHTPQIGPGARLGPYQLEALLGEGGMGQVFRGRDTRLGRLIAVKLIRAERVASGDLHVRFQREAQATAALNHPHICALFDVGEHEGAPYLVMEFLSGQTLADRLHEGPLPLDRLLQYSSEISLALAAAHELGIIHRDLKPSNVMVTSAGVKVLDFGLAKFAGPDAASMAVVTGAQTILGTPAYMSPEQTRGEELDARSDLFSLGCLLYEAATGVRPFRGSSVPDTLREIVSRNPVPASSLRPELPPGWDDILHRLLAKDRNRRYQSAAELFQDFEEIRRHSQRPSAPRTEERQPDAVFGREKELQKLDALLASALAGAGRLALVTGEPGIGKTALTGAFVYNARKRNPDVLLARGACEEQYGTAEPYLLFLDTLGSLLNGTERERVIVKLRQFAPTWCLQFPAVFSSDAMEQLHHDATGASRERMLRELGDALVAMTAETPVILVLEDLHWVDPASVDMLRHLAGRTRAQRLLVVGTARPEEVERTNQPLKNCWAELSTRGVCEEIPLAVLGAGHIAAYLGAHYKPNDFPSDFATFIHRKTEGHPLFAIGTMQLLAERGQVVCENGVWTLAQPLANIALDVPGSMRSLIEKKLSLLTEPQRQIMLCASIEGEEFTSTVLAALLKTSELELEDQLHTIQKMHRLIWLEDEQELPDGSVATRYRFTHALYQYYAYDQLLHKRKALLHRLAGETLERIYSGQHAQVSAALATHFERGREFSKAATYIIQAGDNAVSRYANAEAAVYYSRGLELMDKLPGPEKTEKHMRLMLKRGVAHLALGRLKESSSDYLALREISRTAHDQEQECRALIGLTVVANFERDLTAMQRYGSEAMALAGKIRDSGLEVEAANNWATFMQVQGRLADAEKFWQSSVPLARSSGHRQALSHGLRLYGLMRFWKSEYEAAEAMQSEAAQVTAEVRDGFTLPLALFYLGLTRGNLGKISEALSALQESLDFARRNDHGVALTRAPNGIGWLLREMGEIGKAIELDRANVEVARRAGAAEGESNALVNLVYDYIATGELMKASEALEAAEALSERELYNRWRYFGIRHQAAAAEFWLVRGKLDRAEEHARVLLQNASSHCAPKYLAIARRLLGEIAALSGDHYTAEEQLTRSLEVFATHPAPLVEWRNHLALARLLTSRNRPGSAREEFERASVHVRRLAASINDPILRDVFLRTDAVREVFAGRAQD